FATSTNPATVYFMPHTSGVPISRSEWDSAVAVIGNAPTYYWAIGECDAATFTPHSVWRRFTVPPCSMALSSPASNAAISLPQNFPCPPSVNSPSQSLRFAALPNPSLVYFTPQSSGFSVTQAYWDSVVAVIGNAPTYYWSVGECSGSSFTARTAWQ